MEHKELAMQLFHKGYNCAQSVFCAFCDVTGFDLGNAARLASSFGGGMGRMREVCGAVSGALMVLGYLRGYSDPEDQEAKAAQYAKVQEFARRFREQNGSIICRELLANVETAPGSAPEVRTNAYYHARPCEGFVADAAMLLDQFLAESAPSV